jgi:hypothetical protein
MLIDLRQRLLPARGVKPEIPHRRDRIVMLLFRKTVVVLRYGLLRLALLCMARRHSNSALLMNSIPLS